MHTRYRQKDGNQLLKSNLIVCIISMLIISSLTIGYSSLSKQLDINANVTIGNNETIRITSISTYESFDGAYEVYDATHTENTFTSNVFLPNINSKISYDITIFNGTVNKMKIKSIVSPVYNNSDIKYKITGASVGDIINPDSYLTLTIVFEYEDTVLPNNNALGSLFEFGFEEYSQAKDYVVNGKILDLRGYEMPNNDSWVDQRNNKSMNLNNVFYNSHEKYYDFSTKGAYATLGESIIPTTGDFTLEALVKFSIDTMLFEDQAIVAQVDDDENDLGRFKLNAKKETNLTLLVFFNSQSPSTNQFLYFDRTVEAEKYYHMQVVRTANKLNLYLNGVLISSNTYATSNILSSGPFKLAKWNSKDTQQFYGGIYSVRVYDRALNDAELSNNVEVDHSTYFHTSTLHDLKQYALDTVVSEGEGLYNTGNNIYKYKGVNVKNYIKFSGDNNLYRIVSFNANNTIKLFNVSSNTNTPFDVSGNRPYNELTNSYCTSASTYIEDNSTVYYGCNAYYATQYNGLTVSKDSTVKTVVDNWYENLDSSIKSYVVPHTYNAGLVNESSKYNSVVTQNSSVTYTSNVGLLDVIDVLDASVNTPSSLSSGSGTNNYIIKSANSNSGFWLANGAKSNTYDVWTVMYGTQFGKRRASRDYQTSSNINAYIKAKPVITIYDDVVVRGVGTINSPFVIIERGR